MAGYLRSSMDGKTERNNFTLHRYMDHTTIAASSNDQCHGSTTFRYVHGWMFIRVCWSKIHIFCFLFGVLAPKSAKRPQRQYDDDGDAAAVVVLVGVGGDDEEGRHSLAVVLCDHNNNSHKTTKVDVDHRRHLYCCRRCCSCCCCCSRMYQKSLTPNKR